MEKEKRGFTAAIKHFFTNESNFRLVYLGCMFFASLNLIRDYFYLAAGISLIWGAFLFGYNYIYKRRLRLMHNRRLIYLFLGCALISCLLHAETHLIANIYVWIFMAVCFFFFYGLHMGQSRNACRKEAALIFDLIIGATAVLMLAGLVLLFICPKGFEYGGDHFAIRENRFVGILFNANVTGFYAVCAVLLMNINWVMKRANGSLNRKWIIYYSVCTVINLLALFLSDSNDSLLLLIIDLCFVSFYALFRGYQRGVASFIGRIFALLLACIVISYGLIGARTIVQSGVSFILTSAASGSPDAQISTGVTANDGVVKVKPDLEKRENSDNTTFEHKNTNLDSGRFTIWKQSAAMLKENPFFGVGKANIVDYGKKYLGGLRYDDFHNGLITILISYGAVGLNIFMVLAVTIAKSMFKAIFRYRKENRRDGRVLMYLTAFSAGYCAYSLLEVALLVDISYRVVIFWLILGLAMSYVFSYERSALIAHENINKRSHSLYRLALHRATINR